MSTNNITPDNNVPMCMVKLEIDCESTPENLEKIRKDIQEMFGVSPETIIFQEGEEDDGKKNIKISVSK